uniref:Uncharacterized protein n=1 Tax=Salix viminalis TaxID=40686 RepID=A0A6N2KE17_SALVM
MIILKIARKECPDVKGAGFEIVFQVSTGIQLASKEEAVIVCKLCLKHGEGIESIALKTRYTATRGPVKGLGLQ